MAGLPVEGFSVAAPELVLLAGEIRRFDHVALRSGQFGRLVIDHDGDRAEHQYKRRQGQQDEFSPELHGSHYA